MLIRITSITELICAKAPPSFSGRGNGISFDTPLSTEKRALPPASGTPGSSIVYTLLEP